MMQMSMIDVSSGIRYNLARVIDSWEPPARPNCSNCSNCRVYGRPAAPFVRCAAGYDNGKRIDVGRVIRPVRPVGFRSAIRCPDYDSMDDPA